jgi:probable F420-dependent oxidoreductase
MRIGIHIPNTDDGLDPLKVAMVAEELGFESIFVPEHSHIPMKRESAFPAGGPLLPEYYRMQDPFVTLAAIAMMTKKILLGTGVCVVPQHNPIVLAKTVATLDRFAHGRFVFGVGQGWNDEETRNTGTDPKFKLAIMSERIRAMKTIWTSDRAEFHGQHVQFDPIFSWPKPLQKPHPPILIAGAGPTVLKRVVDYGDGWYPVHDDDLLRMKNRIQELRELASAADSGPRSVTIGTRRVDLLDYYASIGVDRVLLRLPPGPTGEVIELLDEYANTGAAYMR